MSRGWVGVALLAPVLGGCIVSTGGLTGGGGDGGAQDASVDSALPPDAADAAEAEAGALADAEADAPKCAPFAPPDGGPPLACPAPADAGGPNGEAGAEAGPVCAVANLASFTLDWIPPHAPMTVCSTSQISMIVSCLDSTTTTCNTFLKASANAPCIKCMFSDLTSTGPYGPILLVNDIDILNIAGCITLTQPCQKACAYASLAVQQCHYAACASCPLDSTGLASFENCTDVADTCSCLPEATVDNACGSVLENDPATAGCYPLNGFNAAAQFAGQVFCGGGP